MVLVFEEEIKLRDYLHILRKRRWLIISIVFVIVTSITILTFRQIPVYQATTRILIEKETPNVLSFKEVLDLDTSDQDYYQTQYKILKSRSLAKLVIQQLGIPQQQISKELAEETFSIRGYISVLLTSVRNVLGFYEPKPLSEDEKLEEAEEQVIKNFLSMIEINPIRGSRLVDISAKSTNRKQTALVANALAEVYIEQNLESKLAASKDAVRWLAKEVGITQKKVADSESALQEYKEQHGILSFEERQNIVMQKLSELNTAVNEVKIKRSAIEAEYRQIQKYGTAKLESIPQVINNPLIQELKVELSNLETQLSELQKKFRSKHPNVSAVKSQITSARKRLNGEIQRIFTSIKSEYDVARAQERELMKMLEQQKREAQELNQKAIRYGELEREVESNRRIYNALLQRTKETSVTERLQTNNIRIVDRATVPNTPIAPKKIQNVFLAIVIGLIMGISVAFFFEYLDNSIRTSEDIEQYLDIPFLGIIPKVAVRGSISNGKRSSPDTIVAVDPKSNASEAYRSLRTNVTFSLLNDDYFPLNQGAVLLITSPGPSEGKSCIVANLGIAMAQSGSKTLIIDCDFRKPVIHKIFNLKNERGFTDMLTRVRTNGSKIGVKRTNVKNLDVIPCGTVPPNPSELLGSTVARIIIEALAEKYDKIIIDSPPVNTVTDPVILSRIADGVIFIMRAGETKRDIAQRARDQLRSVEAPILGGVLNSVDLKKERYYYHYYSYYYNHYYGEKGKTKADA